MEYVITDLKPAAAGKVTKDPNGQLLIFGDHPIDGWLYYMGVDIGSGIGLSNSVIHVYGQAPGFEIDEQAAEFTCDFLNPHEMAPVINMVGNIFWSEVNRLPAMACIEINNKGEGCQQDLLTYYGYTNVYVPLRKGTKTLELQFGKYGWENNVKSRKRAVLQGYHQFLRGEYKINSPWLVNELHDFKRADALLPRKDNEEEAIQTARAGAGKKDDRVLAWLIANYCANELRPHYIDPAIKRLDQLKEAHHKALEQERTGEKVDFQNTAATAEQYWESFE